MRKLFFTVLVFVFIFSFSSFVSAQSENAQIPEKNGDYADPIHPGVRVRVFVHEGGRPASSSALVCNDPNSESVTPSAGWHLPATVTYKLNAASAPSSVGSGNVSVFAATAFDQWASASVNKISFTYGGTTTANKQALDGQNIIAWGRTSGSALAVTYTRYYTATKEVADVDTIMNLKFSWNWSGGTTVCPANANAYDAQNILTHELGHWVGLDDTYAASFVDNTMYGYGAKGEIKKNTLTNGDVLGVQTIYP